MKRIAVAALLALLCTAASADLVVGIMPAINSVPLVVAEEMGFFEEEGVKVRLELFQGQLQREAALQSRAIDGTVSDLINAIQGWSRGAPTAVLAVSEGDFGLLTAPGSRIGDLAAWRELGGRKVSTGLLEASIVYYVTERLVARAGIDRGSIELVPVVQVPVRLEMLLAGQLQAACLPEPLSSLAASLGAHLVASSSSLGGAYGVLLFRREAAAGKRAEIAAFFRAYDRAAAEINAHPRAHLQAIVSRCGFPPAVRDLLQLPRFKPAHLPPRESVRDVASWMEEKGLIDSIPAWDQVVLGGFARQDAGTP
jgi:NitT/TauT family transport system substrate-binding protein